MAIITEKQKAIHFVSPATSGYDDLDSFETLQRDWELIQEAEREYDPTKTMSAVEAYYKLKKHIEELGR